MLSIIDRYLLQEELKVLVVMLVTLTLNMVSTLFLRVLEDVAVGELRADVVMQFVAIQILRYFPQLLPPAFFFSVLFVLGRMYRDSEMIAFTACGVGPIRLYRAFLYSTLPLTAFTAWLSLEVQPWAAGEMQRIIDEQKAGGAELAGIQAGRFKEFSRGDLVFYVETIEQDSRQMENIFVQNRQHGTVGLVVSKRGFHRYDPTTGDHYLTLVDGHRYEGNPGQLDYSVIHFERYTLRIGRQERQKYRKRSARKTETLIGSDDLADRAELEDRFSYPLAIITLALIAIPLSKSLPRQGIYGRMFLAFLVYFTFLNLQGVAENWLEVGVTPPWMGMWWYQVLLLALAFLLLLPETRLARVVRRRLHGGGKREGGESQSAAG